MDSRLESILGFDRVRKSIADRCSTEYAVDRVENEEFSSSAAEIMHRLSLTDEMRMIVMFEDSFPSNGYIDCVGFLGVLQADGANIDLLSLGKLRTMLDTLRRITEFFSLSPGLLELSAGVYQLNASPVASETRIAGAVMLMCDVTEKSRAEQMRREFTANVSHELKTPLHSISGYAELLCNGMVRPEDIGQLVDFVSIDVAFISLTKVLGPVYELMAENSEIVCLIKPQFEAGREKVGRKGVVRDKKVHEEVITTVTSYAAATGFELLQLDYSPIKGPEGNIEYLLYARKNAPDEAGIRNSSLQSILAGVKEIVDAAHDNLDK